MNSRLSWLVGVVSIVMLPLGASAQEAAISGTVTDTTGGVLPGVAVVAVHVDSGNVFETVTDGTGSFRVPARIGAFEVTVALPGFTTVTQTGLQLQVGQQAAMRFEMAPATLEETITVTGEAPLLETTSSNVGSNIDANQMSELPVNGRNWMDLAMLAAGSRQNESSGAPLMRQGYSQINIDGQQVTTNFIGLGNDQPRFSRDAIAEFELITNRFDATQGRSTGMLVNAVTKSGTNTYAGSVSGFFRDDKFNAKDFIRGEVLPYSNQQVSTTLGGPIRQDRIHFFSNFEYEREPQVIAFNTPFPQFNEDFPNTRTQQTGGAKVDIQFSSATRLSVRAQLYNQDYHTGGGANRHPSGIQLQNRNTQQYLATLTQVIGNSTVNEIKGGASRYTRLNEPISRWNGGDFPNAATYSFRHGTATRVNVRGYRFGDGNTQNHNQYKTSIRDDLTLSFAARGRHDVKIGGEFISDMSILRGCGSTCRPTLAASNGRVPASILTQVIPVGENLNPAAWNLDLLAPYSQRYELSIGEPGLKGFYREMPSNIFGVWLQDDWNVSPRLTLNIGVRWDMETGNGAKVNLPPFLPGNLSEDTNNFGPRVGFAYSAGDSTVIRGGYGLFYAEGTADEMHQTMMFVLSVFPQVLYDGRADFPTNPYDGPAPTRQELLAQACDLGDGAAGCVKRSFIPEMVDPFFKTPWSHQASIGFQHQIGSFAAIESNYVYTGGRGEEGSKNVNLNYNPATGGNYDFRDEANLPLPDFGRVQLTAFEGWSNYQALESSITKRMSNRWQAQLTYTVAKFQDASALPFQHFITNGVFGRSELGFPVARDLGGDYTLAATNQTHRAVFNGIFEAPFGIQLSGLYFYGSGQRLSTNVGADLRQEGAGGEDRLRDDGTIADRNNLVGLPLHRVDMRLQKRVNFGGGPSLDGIVELFNVFNHKNYGSYTKDESNRNFGLPTFNSNIAYQPRSMQFGFRLIF
ncbi:MAG: TonB-dependent receptor [Acidobacteria bacterium]|nr:TonB-dependent receptor [Acidobacteriota bacterium]